MIEVERVFNDAPDTLEGLMYKLGGLTAEHGNAAVLEALTFNHMIALKRIETFELYEQVKDGA